MKLNLQFLGLEVKYKFAFYRQRECMYLIMIKNRKVNVGNKQLSCYNVSSAPFSHHKPLESLLADPINNPHEDTWLQSYHCRTVTVPLHHGTFTSGGQKGSMLYCQKRIVRHFVFTRRGSLSHFNTCFVQETHAWEDCRGKVALHFATVKISNRWTSYLHPLEMI